MQISNPNKMIQVVYILSVVSEEMRVIFNSTTCRMKVCEKISKTRSLPSRNGLSQVASCCCGNIWRRGDSHTKAAVAQPSLTHGRLGCHTACMLLHSDFNALVIISVNHCHSAPLCNYISGLLVTQQSSKRSLR